MSFIGELQRRNVFRVAAAYTIVGWLLVQIASVLLPTFESPEWVMKGESTGEAMTRIRSAISCANMTPGCVL